MYNILLHHITMALHHTAVLHHMLSYCIASCLVTIGLCTFSGSSDAIECHWSVQDESLWP